jgi:hypothetical protein
MQDSKFESKKGSPHFSFTLVILNCLLPSLPRRIGLKDRFKEQLNSLTIYNPNPQKARPPTTSVKNLRSVSSDHPIENHQGNKNRKI